MEDRREIGAYSADGTEQQGEGDGRRLVGEGSSKNATRGFGKVLLTISCVVRSNCCSKLVILRETLKKSIASQAQANHLRQIKMEIKVQPNLAPLGI